MGKDNQLLKLVYTLFIGVLLSIFIGVGISTFYPSPEAPGYVEFSNPEGKVTTAQEEQQWSEYDKKSRAYEEAIKPYSRNVSIIALIAAVLLLASSAYAEKRKIGVIADGIMLGGFFTLLYSLGRGFTAQDDKYVFLVVTVGLAFALYVGYHRFATDTALKTSKAKKK